MFSDKRRRLAGSRGIREGIWKVLYRLSIHLSILSRSARALVKAVLGSPRIAEKTDMITKGIWFCSMSTVPTLFSIASRKNLRC
jgi:hypothetical protein